jgi:drug/metabolite transporter (DMT)-like permease
VNNGFLLGAMAALVWGVTDILVVQWARRVGVLRTLLTVQGSGVLLMALLAVVLGEDLSLSGGQWVAIAALGALSFGAYLGFYRALELGPIAIVSPIASSNGAMIVVLAVIVLGESLTAGQAVGITLVLTFIVLASVEPAAERLSRERNPPGAGSHRRIRPLPLLSHDPGRRARMATADPAHAGGGSHARRRPVRGPPGR